MNNFLEDDLIYINSDSQSSNNSVDNNDIDVFIILRGNRLIRIVKFLGK